jgi:hypothetical protein
MLLIENGARCQTNLKFLTTNIMSGLLLTIVKTFRRNVSTIFAERLYDFCGTSLRFLRNVFTSFAVTSLRVLPSRLYDFCNIFINVNYQDII